MIEVKSKHELDIIEKKTAKLRAVYIYSPSCYICQATEYFLKDIEKDHLGFNIFRVNADTFPDEAKPRDADDKTKLPIFKIYKDSDMVYYHMGFMLEEEIRDAIKKASD